MLYSANNAAKQWILEELENRFQDAPSVILDLACGAGWIWEQYLMKHQQARVVGVDYDKQAIMEGKKRYGAHPRIELRVGNAQRPVEADTYDAVVALSAIEHVVDRKAFLKAAHKALKRGGMAYLNYDAGHFRSKKLKERLMVPVSQFLAAMGLPGSYMKQVDDGVFRKQAEEAGFRVVDLRKHNIATLKGPLRGAPAEAIDAWYDFEERLGAVMPPNALDHLMLSTTLVLQKV